MARLEVGCGGGGHFLNLKLKGEDVIYVDVERPRAKVENFVVADACHLPFKSEAFERIYASLKRKT